MSSARPRGREYLPLRTSSDEERHGILRLEQHRGRPGGLFESVDHLLGWSPSRSIVIWQGTSRTPSSTACTAATIGRRRQVGSLRSS